MERPEEIKREFATRRRRQRAVLVLVVLVWGLLLVMIRSGRAAWSEPESALPIFVGSAFVIMAFVLWNWRCPSCRRFLGRIRNPMFCPRCGVALQ